MSWMIMRHFLRALPTQDQRVEREVEEIKKTSQALTEALKTKKPNPNKETTLHAT